VLAQSFTNWELVVVDHSPIPVAAPLRGHPAWANSSYVRLPAQRPAAAARNLGVRMIRGEYVAFLDPDDRFTPEHLARAVDALAAEGTQAALATSRLVLERSNPTASVTEPLGVVAPFGGDAFDIATLEVAHAVPLGALVFYRGLLDRCEARHGRRPFDVLTGGMYDMATLAVLGIRNAPVHTPEGVTAGEIEATFQDGVLEVTLLGQNVNSYGRDLGLDGHRPLFADLLRQVGRVDGIQRIRYTSPHPKDFTKDVALAMAEVDAVCPHLHLPVQSGSDRMLKAMHRGYKSERYRRKIEVFREAVSDGTLSTDIIVGHPGETEEDH